MRIANVIEEAKVGGPQIRMMAVAQAIKNEADTIIVMPSDNSEDFKCRCDKKNVPYIAINLSRITKEKSVALRYVFFFSIEIFKLYKIMRNEDVQVVHVSGGSWQFKGVIAGRLSRKKVLWHLNDTSMPGFIRGVFWLFSRLADGYIFASERSRDYYGNLVDDSKPQFVIPAPVDISHFNTNFEFHDLENDLGRWKGKIVIGLVGNVSRVKGLETFIRMAFEANRLVDNLQFVIAGPVFSNQQKYYDSLCKLTSELGVINIEFVGGRKDVRPLLKRFDIYVCSSNAESSPLSVWEAMAMALPIVSTDVGDVPLYVTDEVNGYIVPVGDHQAMAGYICKLAGDHELRRNLGEAARIKVCEELDIKRCAEKHLEAYRAVVGEYAGSSV